MKGFQKKNVYDSPHVREFRFRNPRNFCLCNPESGKICLWNPGLWNPEYSSRNPPSHYWWESGIQVPSSKFQCLESGIHAVRNPESKPVLDSLPRGDIIMNALLVETERNAGCGYLWQNMHGRDGNLNKQHIWGKKKHMIYIERHSKLSKSRRMVS